MGLARDGFETRRDWPNAVSDALRERPVRPEGAVDGLRDAVVAAMRCDAV